MSSTRTQQPLRVAMCVVMYCKALGSHTATEFYTAACDGCLHRESRITWLAGYRDRSGKGGACKCILSLSFTETGCVVRAMLLGVPVTSCKRGSANVCALSFS